MLNSRVSTAAARAKWVAAIGALGFIFVTLLTVLFYQNRPSLVGESDCSGYGGAPSHDFVANSSSAAEAERYCAQQIPKLSISVKNRNYINLQRKRLEALDRGVLLTSGADFVPAYFSFEGKTLKGKIRLKGDWTTHLQEKHSWSLRVILSGDYEILGRRRFSLQVPKVRHYDVEPLYFLQLMQAGLMPPRHKLVEVELNGEPWGVMTLEDHFTKELMEVHKRKETIIGRFDESDMWVHQVESGDHGPFDSLYTSEFVPFNERKVKQSPTLAHYGQLASSMMSAWQEGRLSLAQILDLDAYSRFILITEAWGGWHAFRWHNLRFYLNPYTLKFEPVPYDNGMPLVDISKLAAFIYFVPNSTAHSIITPPLSELYEDPKMLPRLKAEMEVLYDELIASPRFDELRRERAFLKEVFEQNGMPITVNPGLLKKNYDHLKNNFDDYFRARDGTEPVPENPESRQYSSLVKVNIYEEGVVSLANKAPFEVQIEDVKIESRFGGKESLKESLPLPITLQATPLRSRPTPVFLDISLADPRDYIEITVRNPNTGQVLRERQRRRLTMLDEKSYLATSPLLHPPSTAPGWIVESAAEWRIPEGSWILTEPLIPPAGTSLHFEAGARLRVAENAFILARGPLDLDGTESKPVVIEARDGIAWGGVYVINAGGVSRWQNAHIRHLKPFQLTELTLTGALNFYRSDLEIDQVVIDKVIAEDAINMVESRFEFSGLHLDDSTSDGIDSDYSNGRIVASSFSNIGGDAIDTSGSQVKVESVKLRAIRDKSISAGEASTLTLENVDIDTVGVGIAVKDFSKVTATGADIRNTGLAAIMAYSKKPEYGGAYVTARDIQYDQSAEIAICQLGSTLLLEGTAVTPQNVNVDYLYGEGIMRK